jgi:hypothetical protein
MVQTRNIKSMVIILAWERDDSCSWHVCISITRTEHNLWAVLNSVYEHAPQLFTECTYNQSQPIRWTKIVKLSDETRPEPYNDTNSIDLSVSPLAEKQLCHLRILELIGISNWLLMQSRFPIEEHNIVPQ